MPTGSSVIDPVNRIEGHLRIDMEVTDGFVTDAWVSGGLFRGMELVLENRQPTDAAMISQRICGVCPVSHANTSCLAGERSYGITIPNGARIIRNIVEGAQFLHSNILWFYNLVALDYVNPLDALNADIEKTIALADAAGTTQADFAGIQKRLKEFAENGQLSIFSGNWFDAIEHDGSSAYKLTPELNLICTAHYLEALEMQAVASEISGIIGGKMPHIMTSVPGGTAFVPTEEKLDDLLFRAKTLLNWVETTMIPDTYAIAPFYMDEFGNGQTDGNYIAWGVFDTKESLEGSLNNPGAAAAFRDMPGGVFSFHESNYKAVQDWDADKIVEYTNHSFYDPADDGPKTPHVDGVTHPDFRDEYALPELMVNGSNIGGHPTNSRYTWDKAPRYDDMVVEAGGLSRLLVAYGRGNEFIVEQIDALLAALGVPGQVEVLNSTMGRTGGRNVETYYIATKMVEWITELVTAIKGGKAEDVATFAEPATRTGDGYGMWEAPRGALYHYMDVKDDKIQKYQIIIPTTWNISPRDPDDRKGPIEKAMIGLPVEDLQKPIHALRVVHSFDPCVACAVHISEPATGKKFSVVTSPWGVK
jgi:hydrogenase large subunit